MDWEEWYNIRVELCIQLDQCCSTTTCHIIYSFSDSCISHHLFLFLRYLWWECLSIKGWSLDCNKILFMCKPLAETRAQMFPLLPKNAYCWKNHHEHNETGDTAFPPCIYQQSVRYLTNRLGELPITTVS